MFRVQLIYIVILLTSCIIHNVAGQNEKTLITQPDSSYNVPLHDSTCFKRFYEISSSFLDEKSSKISEYTRIFYLDCCLYLIRSGDSLAQNILFHRVTEHARKLLEGDPLYYYSLHEIFFAVLAKIPSHKSIEIAMLLFDKSKCEESGITPGTYHHLGYLVLEPLIGILEKDKALEYYKEIRLYQQEADLLGYNDYDCKMETFVFRKIREKLIADYEDGRLSPRLWSEMPKLTRHDEPTLMRHDRERKERKKIENCD